MEIARSEHIQRMVSSHQIAVVKDVLTSDQAEHTQLKPAEDWRATSLFRGEQEALKSTGGLLFSNLVSFR